jgi:hypothetical protein
MRVIGPNADIQGGFDGDSVKVDRISYRLVDKRDYEKAIAQHICGLLSAIEAPGHEDHG